MINILSVDIDWIMEPSIQIYNWLINEDTETEQFNLEVNAPGVVLPPDLYKFYQLNKILFTPNCKVDKDSLVIQKSHKSIVRAISNWKINEPYVVWNVDHHHDCGYTDKTGNARQAYYNGATCGNWAAYLALHDKNLKQYCWIGNFNSNHDIDEDIKKQLPQYHYFENINILSEIKFDKIFICRSPGWMPDNVTPLVDTLTTTFESFIKL